MRTSRIITRDNNSCSAKSTDSQKSVLDAIGNTPIAHLRRIAPKGSARILAKLEFANPTGSMKDRVAKAMVEAAEADGRLSPGGTVVEYTAGTTGISLALTCAAKRYGLKIVFSDAFSEEKRLIMQAFGAEVQDVKSDGKRITEKLIKEMVERARGLSQQPGHWYCNQLSNHDGTRGYHPLGEEIWSQTNGKVDAFVQAVGTAHSIHGVTEALWKHKPGVHVAAVEPVESAVLSGKPTGSHKIEGIGIGYVPPLWNPKMVSEIITVTTEDAKAMARRLAKEEALFVGTSSGANVVAALEVAKRLGPEATVVTIMVDSGQRYLSTDLFRNVSS
ncbi:MAG TPA: cysteine synthase family protein [Nitrososphaerales archaeon]|nr:cysteine synthase family protein [Nitrososphaerales archaeon]